MWTISPEKRLIEWREFRDHISTLSNKDAILLTAKLWSTAPISNQYLAPDLINDWPDPWTLINDNIYDDISITLGMIYTLTLASNKFNDAIMKVMTDINNSTIYHTAWFDHGKYILNYEYNNVVELTDLSEGLRCRYKYSYEDLKIAQYK